MLEDRMGKTFLERHRAGSRHEGLFSRCWSYSVPSRCWNLCENVFSHTVKCTFPMFTLKKEKKPCPHRPFIPEEGFLKPGSSDIWEHIMLWCVGCPGYCRMFGSIPGLYPFDASSTPIYENQNCFHMLPNVSWQTKSP